MSGAFTKEQIEAILKPCVGRYKEALSDYETAVESIIDEIASVFESVKVDIGHDNSGYYVDLKLVNEPDSIRYYPYGKVR